MSENFNPHESNDLATEKIPEKHIKQNLLGKWSKYFIEKKRVTFLIVLAILIWGIMSYIDLPQEVNPEVTIPAAFVQTVYQGASPEEVESLVTNKIENKISQIEGVKRISSTSGLGYSFINVEFESSEDSEDMLQKIRDKASESERELPDDVESPVVSDIKTSDTPIMIVNLYGNYDRVSLKNFAENIKDELEKNNRISDVNIVGGLEREIKVNVNPQKLSQYNLTLDKISSAISNSNVNFPGGNVTLDKRNYNIRTVGRFEDVKQIENTVVSMVNGRPLLLKDIGLVIDGYSKSESISRLASNEGSNGFEVNDSISISIIKKESGSIIDVSKQIKELLENQRGISFPKDLGIAISGDLANIVEEELGNVIANAASGLFLVIIVLFLFVGIKESLIVSFIIPTSIFAAFGLMNSNDVTLNTISLFSLILAVGLMVDNGIIVVENIHRLQKKGLSSYDATVFGTNQIAPAVAASTLTTIAAFFPILLTPGIMGDFIRQIPQTVIFALIASFFVAITITPSLSAFFLKNKAKPDKKIASKIKKILSVIIVFVLGMMAFKEDGSFWESFGLLSFTMAIIFSLMMYIKQFKIKADNSSRFIAWYSEKLYWLVQTIKRRFAILGIMALLFVFSFALVISGVLKIEMFPSTDSTRLYINIETPKGTILEDTEKVVSDIEKILFNYSEIDNFVSNIGISGADNFDFGVSSGGEPNNARIIIELLELEAREKTSIQIAEELRGKVKNITAGKISVEEVRGGPPSAQPVDIQIKGDNLDDIKNTAKDVAKILEEIEGTRDVNDGITKGLPEIKITVRKDKASAFGLSDIDVAIGVRNAINGLKTTVFRQDQDEIDVVIRTEENKLDSIEDIKRLYFFSRTGQRIPFQEVANVSKSESLNAIRHLDGNRIVSVTSFIDDGIVANDIITKFEEKISSYTLPDGISLTYGGEAEEIKEAFTDLFTSMIIAIILVFLILAVQFNSLSQPFIILISVPLALIGVINGLIITGYNFDFIAFVGFVGLVGIAVNDAIVFIDYINYLKKEGYDTNLAIKETGKTRFIPVVATTITTTGGILPITLKDEFLGSMGYTLIFGLMVTSFLTLVIIPIVYTLIEDFKKYSKKKLVN